MKPIALAANQFPHFYRGGAAIADFRAGRRPADDNLDSGWIGGSGWITGADEAAAAMRVPEDWVASTTTRHGSAALGLSMLPDGVLLRDDVAAKPEEYLGADHVAAFGADLGLLVKLLDASQRLPVHCHPDRAFAHRHLGVPHGKTEAWLVLHAPAGAVVHLGFREEVPAATLARWVAEQDVGPLLDALNVVPVQTGMTILVPAGLPHAIGAGVFVLELQEPTDLSLMLEWKGFDVDGEQDGHLGLGYDTALSCVDRSGWTARRLAGLRGPADDRSARQSLLPAQAARFFRAELLRGGATVEPGFSVLVVTHGAGELITSTGVSQLRRGDTVLLPYASGPATVTGDLRVVRCRPPDPAAAVG